ncbi:MAG TPA: hypothetical protein VKI00_24125 [Mycobacterium sp.]|uniref:hypothetical protein n=1 Tax=Mycobacterium sp. TaxID=1785 RepID=UPI002CF2A411|nr:hypothetical protein [Mycobacterium sp.]HME78622.1 hypothetical protein [Mycobacterium sp.]
MNSPNWGVQMVMGDWLAGERAGKIDGEADARAARPYNPHPAQGPFDSDDYEHGYYKGYEIGYGR